VAASLEASNQLLGLISISYPYSVLWFLTFFSSSRPLSKLESLTKTPTLFLIGSRDNFSSVSAFEKLVEKHVKAPKVSRVIDNIDHFYYGDEDRPLVVIEAWLKQTFERFLGAGESGRAS
jgi:fermentation-respiration switch protein FrsA (DUF1100 family)